MKIIAFSWIILFILPANASADGNKGCFVLVGGGGTDADIRSEFVRLAGGNKARIIVIPSASAVARPEKATAMWRSYQVAVTVLHAPDRTAASEAKLYDCLDRATGVWIGGGKQSRLMYLFGGTPLAHKLQALLARGGVVGGTSAGAAVMSSVMVLRSGESRGLGLLDHCIIDTHFSQRKRSARLCKLLEKHKGPTGYGIDEKTALVLSGQSIKIIGIGKVTRYRPNGALDELLPTSRRSLPK